jgi:RNA polymerase sigma factor (sigma-70 family)
MVTRSSPETLRVAANWPPKFLCGRLRRREPSAWRRRDRGAPVAEATIPVAPQPFAGTEQKSKNPKKQKKCVCADGVRESIFTTADKDDHFEDNLGTRTSQLPMLLQAFKRTLDERSDSQLLADFLDRHDQEAFEHLVYRHARHVWSICCRVLNNPADAEDAFQAAFIVLIRSGRMIADRGAIGGWLYKTAYRVALKARAMIAKRRQKEQAAVKAEIMPACSAADPDLSKILNEELGRLSEPCRLALLMCDLDGLTRKQASAQLGWKETTLAGRLERGRKVLAKRLRRRGLTAPAVLAAAGASTLPTNVVASTISLAHALVVVGAGLKSAAVPATVAELASAILRDMTMRIATKALATALLIAGILGGARYGLMLNGSPIAVSAQPASISAPNENKPASAPGENLRQIADGKVQVPVGAVAHAQRVESDVLKDLKFIRGIATASLHNRESFQVFRCTYIARTGEAESVEKAIAGEITEEATANGIWVVNKKRVRFDLICNEKALAKAFAENNGSGSISVPFPSNQFIDSGPKHLRYSTIMGSANIADEMVPAHGIELSPFDMGIMGSSEIAHPARLILSAPERGHYCRYDPDGMLGNAGVQVVCFGFDPGASQYESIFSFDSTKGFLPTEIRRECKTPGPGTDYAVFVTKSEQFPTGRFFPMRSVLVWDHKSKGPYSVREIVVTSLTVDTPPSNEDFVIELPAGTSLSDGGVSSGVRSITTTQPERVGPDDLERLYQRWQAHVRNDDSEADGALPAPDATPPACTPPACTPPATHTWRLVSIISIALFFLVFVLRGIRRHRKRSATSRPQ